MHIFKMISVAYREWRRKRRWNADLQLNYLRLQVQEDYRWMAHDPKVSALCLRYLAMLSDDWEKQPVLNVADFRRAIDCDPNAGTLKSRLDNLARYEEAELFSYRYKLPTQG